MTLFTYEVLPYYVDEIRRLAETIAKKAVVTIEGVEYDYPITKTVNRDGFFKHYIEVEDEPVGNIERIVLMNENDIPLAEGTGLIEKDDEGWQFAFKVFVTLQEKEGELNG